MLKNLYISNYALIQNLAIDFRQGLSIITGETGAGKSILLGALGLVTGKRADTNVLYNKDEKCVVEALFSISGYRLKDFFEAHDIDYCSDTTIRREISPNGKSRAFINDTPVILDTLSALSSKLIDIHSQHENLLLNSNLFQLKVVDLFGNNTTLLERYKTEYARYQRLKKEFDTLLQDISKLKADVDYVQFQFNQLDVANLLPDEQEGLETELKQLTHAGEIRDTLENALQLIWGDEPGVVANLKTLSGLAGRLTKFLSGASELELRIDAVFIELKDIGSELERMNNQINLDPGRLEEVSQRIDLIYNLQQKHGVRTMGELIALKTSYGEQLNRLMESDITTEQLKKGLDTSGEALMKLARELSARREEQFVPIAQKVTALLASLGMPGSRFEVSRQLLPEPGTEGLDEIRFLFTANKNSPLQDFSRIASGGEMSRMMLAIKSIIAHAAGLPTIIFDEIDTGVSGDIADKVGSIIREMSRTLQVINITHLPQVASKGDQHYLVYKQENGGTTKTCLKLLSDHERSMEIAKMLSGETITEAAIENARELLRLSNGNG